MLWGKVKEEDEMGTGCQRREWVEEKRWLMWWGWAWEYYYVSKPEHLGDWKWVRFVIMEGQWNKLGLLSKSGWTVTPCKNLLLSFLLPNAWVWLVSFRENSSVLPSDYHTAKNSRTKNRLLQRTAEHWVIWSALEVRCQQSPICHPWEHCSTKCQYAHNK